ncbi:cystathionine gamma-synthase [Actinophytocola oryzae]|uniref:Cystathionine gamma-synthase n=1 Tax=Actinophytocola oryzae TaxID=502181 RepID=A0A4R7W0U4_9PSEU|nr:cystathionine gamma-synthase [Actinophytocola oryzae]
MCVSAGRIDGPGEPLNVPPVFASSFRTGGEHDYARNEGTPTWAALEDAVGRLEGGTATAYASGMGAVAAIVDLLPPGSRVVVPWDSYTAVRHLVAARGHTVDLQDITDTEATLSKADGAALLWLESPTNPLMDVADLPALCAADTLVAVDNTFATPLLQQPLTFGADIVMHSGSKYIGGHADLLMGLTVTADPELVDRMRALRVLSGATPGGMEAFLATRGLRTLPLRVRQAQESAGELARRLEQHPRVTRVRYPGLPGDPGHTRAAKQMSGFGAMLSFEVAGDAAAADALCAALTVVNAATSLGGVESTIERRARLAGQEHVPPSLLRLSVGCEHVEDLWADLDAALRA